MSGAVITMNEEGFIESINPAAVHMFGYQASEIIGRCFLVLVANPYHTHFLKTLTRLIKTTDRSQR